VVNFAKSGGTWVSNSVSPVVVTEAQRVGTRAVSRELDSVMSPAGSRLSPRQARSDKKRRAPIQVLDVENWTRQVRARF
jgi:hypothetical protein